jgi:hypothetical protein
MNMHFVNLAMPFDYLFLSVYHCTLLINHFILTGITPLSTSKNQPKGVSFGHALKKIKKSGAGLILSHPLILS